MEKAKEMGLTYGCSFYKDREEKKTKPPQATKPKQKATYDKPVPKSVLAAQATPQTSVGDPNPLKEATPQAAAGGFNTPRISRSPCDCFKARNHRYLKCTIFMSKAP
jgi:hypothetical protein